MIICSLVLYSLIFTFTLLIIPIPSMNSPLRYCIRRKQMQCMGILILNYGKSMQFRSILIWPFALKDPHKPLTLYCMPPFKIILKICRLVCMRIFEKKLRVQKKSSKISILKKKYNMSLESDNPITRGVLATIWYIIFSSN